MEKLNEKMEKVLEEKVITYNKLYGEKALYEVIKEKEDFYKFMGYDDYIEIAYKKDNEVKNIKIVGYLLEYGDYLISKINDKYDIVIIKRIKGVYYPMEKIEKGFYI